MKSEHQTEKQAESGPPDTELIRAANGGDRRAFAMLVKRYEDTVYRFAIKLCRDREKAAEAFQDTFINVYRKLSTFDGRSRFSTWLYTIVANNCRMGRRKRKVETLEDPLEVLDHPPVSVEGRFTSPVAPWPDTPADIMVGKELRSLLDAAIEKLPEVYRVTFVLRDVEERTTEETADILNISVEATKSRLRRARAFLRNELAPFMTAGMKNR